MLGIGRYQLTQTAVVAVANILLDDERSRRGEALLLTDGSAPALLSSETGTKTIALSDGSQIELAQQTQLRTRASTATRFETELQRGRAVFDVVPRGPRVWSVRAADVQVKVLGTRFGVALDETTVRVVVERGTVQVTSPALSGTRILHANQSLQLPAAKPAARTGQLGPAESGSTLRSTEELAALSSDAPSADDAAQAAAAARTVHSGGASNEKQSGTAYDRAPGAGDPADAAQAPRKPAAESGARPGAAQRRAVEDRSRQATARSGSHILSGRTTMEVWLQRADSARAARQPGKAASALEQAVADHPRDPRAALAAFTLAQLYMEQLAQPREAARAFERASALGLPAALAEEAAARRVEAYAHARQRVQAYKAAEVYRSKYPNGARASAVTRWLSELQ